MTRRPRASRMVALSAAALLVAAAASAQEVHVVTSGGFTEAYKQLAPRFERDTHIHVVSAFGASMGSTPDAIPNRLNRGEPIDVIILAAPGLDELIKQGKVEAGSRVDLVRSLIAMAVRTGAPKPDISTVDAFKRTLLQAKSVGSSDSASGVYLRTVLFPRLGVAEQLKPKSKVIEAYERVGDAVARGDVEIGFQQVSELRPVPGITIVGPLPEGAQQVTIFSAAIVKGAKNAAAGKRLIRIPLLAGRRAGSRADRSRADSRNVALRCDRHPRACRAGQPPAGARCASTRRSRRRRTACARSS